MIYLLNKAWLSRFSFHDEFTHLQLIFVWFFIWFDMVAFDSQYIKIAKEMANNNKIPTECPQSYYTTWCFTKTIQLIQCSVRRHNLFYCIYSQWLTYTLHTHILHTINVKLELLLSRTMLEWNIRASAPVGLTGQRTNDDQWKNWKSSYITRK